MDAKCNIAEDAQLPSHANVATDCERSPNVSFSTFKDEVENTSFDCSIESRDGIVPAVLDFDNSRQIPISAVQQSGSLCFNLLRNTIQGLDKVATQIHRPENVNYFYKYGFTLTMSKVSYTEIGPGPPLI